MPTPRILPALPALLAAAALIALPISGCLSGRGPAGPAASAGPSEQRPAPGDRDVELTRGERAVANVDRLNDFAAPLRALAQAAFNARRGMQDRGGRAARARGRGDPDEASPEDEAPAA
jgi:hypothetical protein